MRLPPPNMTYVTIANGSMPYHDPWKQNTSGELFNVCDPSGCGVQTNISDAVVMINLKN